MSLLSLIALGMAGEVEVWSYPNFPSDTTLNGYDGWVSGYDQDEWYGVQGQNRDTYAMPLTDDSEDAGCDQRWQGACADNLTHDAEDVTDGRYEALVYSEDDDAIGLAFGVQSADDYLLFILCGSSADPNAFCPLTDLGSGNAGIVHIHNGRAEILEQGRGGFDQYTSLTLSVTQNDGTLTATFGNISLTAASPDDRTLNGVGFYTYNAGYDGQQGGTNVYFSMPTLYALDDDNDGVIDDEDNCEQDSNPDQTDADADGLGAACDPDDAGSGNGDDTGNGNGNDSGNGNGNGNGNGDGAGSSDTGKLEIAGGCSCASADVAAQSSTAFGLLLGALALARRRR